MNFEEYQEYVRRTAKPLQTVEHRLLKGALGLCSEAGEVAGLLEKLTFQGHAFSSLSPLKKELGDTLWYLTYLADSLGWSLREVMEHNVEKLSARYPNGEFSTEDSIARVDGG